MHILKKIIKSITPLLGFFFITGYVFAQNIISLPEQSCLSLKTTLRFGSRDGTISNDVKKLQKFLITKGFLAGDATGYYGKMTVSAVRTYQNSFGISPTGNVGPLTRANIEKQSCQISQGSQNSFATSSPTGAPLTQSILPPASPSSQPKGTNQTIVYYKANKLSNTCMSTTLVTTLNSAYEYKTDEYKTEEECSKSLSPQAVVVCTAEYRSCPDGSTMPRDADCTWRSDKCPVINIVHSTSIISSVVLMRDQNTHATVIRVYGSNLGDFSKLEYNAGGELGVAEQGLLSQNGTVRDLPADSYLSTTQLTSFQVRIVASDGSKGNWINASVSR